MEIPVYLFTGFLDAGKTKFVQETLEDPRFYDGERTLVILCEQGEEEYDSKKYPSDSVFFTEIESEQQLSEKLMLELQRKYRMHRVLIEYNGMWMLQKLYDALPQNWLIYQEMLFCDASTILTYNSNMRNLVADKLYNCEMVIFNRLKHGDDFMPYHKLVRGVTRKANIAYEFTDGEVEYDEIEDPLPFDIEADVIELKDIDYALWYRDLMEETDKYHGKTIKFKGIVAKNDQLPKDTFAIGRHIMICCEEDISFGGIIAKFDECDILESRDWVWITAKISIEYNQFYKEKGPVLYVSSVQHTLPPEQQLATFY